jgi:hypothetical protein
MHKPSLHPILLLVSTLLIFQAAEAQNTSPYWSLAGNSNTSTTSKLGTTNGVSLRFVANNVQRMLISHNNGNVSIGTNTLDARLTVNASSGSNILLGQVAGITRLRLASNGGLSLGSGSTPPTNGLIIAGDVGIGTPVPSAKLQVIGKTLLSDSLTVTGGGITTTNGAYNSNALTAIGNASSGNAILGQGFTGVRGIGTTGVVGYGTYSGINGDGVTYGVYGNSSNGTSTNYGVYGIATNNTNSYVYGYGVYGKAQGSTTAFLIGAYGEGRTYGVQGKSSTGVGVYASSTGGIGLRAYSSQSQGLYATTDNKSAYAGYFGGNVYASGAYMPSARKLKHNITALGSALTLLSKLQPKEYEYKQEGVYGLMHLPEGKRYGLIAEEVEEVLPGLVKATEFDTKEAQNPDLGGRQTADAEAKIDFKALNYTELIPIVIKAVQEQQEDIKQKEQRIATLESELANLRKMVLELKNGANTLSSTTGWLEQNTPNPVSGSTLIRYRVAEAATSAVLNITNAKGQVVKTISLTSRGNGQVNLETSALSAGTYNYILYVEGKQVDSKRFVITR